MTHNVKTAESAAQAQAKGADLVHAYFSARLGDNPDENRVVEAWARYASYAPLQALVTVRDRASRANIALPDLEDGVTEELGSLNAGIPDEFWINPVLARHSLNIDTEYQDALAEKVRPFLHRRIGKDLAETGSDGVARLIAEAAMAIPHDAVSALKKSQESTEG